MISKDFFFTSESVSEGHPDKICDQLSDLVLDIYLKEDPQAKVACENLITTNHLVVAGEVYSKKDISFDFIEKELRSYIAQIGYTHDDIGFNASKARIDILLHEQSSNIRQGVLDGEGLYIGEGAGDQGLMFGFAINETEEYMPMPIFYAHSLLLHLSELRRVKKVSFLRPDSKAQVTVQYKDGKPVSISSLVLSTQHTPDITYTDLKDWVIEECIRSVIPSYLIKDCEFFINPTGVFIIGGPHGDCGLTGRKIIVDTYGGMGRHGGGAFSGKDSSKVDRSAAYMARYLAKNIVASKLASVCELQLAYAIGVAKPISITVNTYGTAKVEDSVIVDFIQKNFDLTPKGIRSILDLPNISYLPTATYGHFGRQGPNFTWEKVNKVNLFQTLLA